jgi:hypothetical protein
VGLWPVVLWLVVLWVLVPWPVASELPAPAAEVPVGVVLDVLEVPIVPDSDVPVALEPMLPLDVAPDAALPLASLLVVAVELHAARLMAIRPPIRRAW